LLFPAVQLWQAHSFPFSQVATTVRLIRGNTVAD
jgi:hypothetical protein